MLQLYYNDFYIFLPFTLNFFIYWVIFFKVNFFGVQYSAVSSDKLQVSNNARNIHYIFYLKINQLFLVLMFVYLFMLRGYVDSVWWNHFKLTNLAFGLILVLLFFNFFFIYVVKSSSFNSGVYKGDYFFALINLSNFLPLIFLANTLFTFLFILEVNSCVVFYKFVVSKFWYNESKSTIKFNNYAFKRLLPKNYLNMLFFQYWATFFSSVIIMYVLISYIYIYGTTEWIMLNMLNELTLKASYHYNYYNNIILSIMLLFAFLIKIGFTPVQLYKIEIYKGIPYIAIFFYTTYYFLVFFLFFILLIVYYLNSFIVYWWFALLFIIVFGGFYVLSLLFDVNYIKAFFAYSTMINSLGFICIAMAMLM